MRCIQITGQDCQRIVDGHSSLRHAVALWSVSRAWQLAFAHKPAKAASRVKSLAATCNKLDPHIFGITEIHTDLSPLRACSQLSSLTLDTELLNDNNLIFALSAPRHTINLSALPQPLKKFTLAYLRPLPCPSKEEPAPGSFRCPI